MTKHLFIGLVFGTALLAGTHTVKAAPLPAYQPSASIEGELRIWGSPADGPLLARWAQQFRQFHPGVQVRATLHGADSTLAGVYSGVADIAFMAREMRQPVERMAFMWVHHRPPLLIEVANAGVNTARPGADLAVMVHQDNPLTQLHMEQLQAILGTTTTSGAPTLQTWGDMGLNGVWKDRPIHIYGRAVDSIDAMFIRDTVLQGSYKWNVGYQEVGSDEQLTQALLSDPAAIAVMPLHTVTAQLKPLALAARKSDTFIALTKQSVVARTYPLARVITMIIDRDPAKSIAPRVREFLRYILSSEGQSMITADNAYLPLTAADAQAQLDRLN